MFKKTIYHTTITSINLKKIFDKCLNSQILGRQADSMLYIYIQISLIIFLHVKFFDSYKCVRGISRFILIFSCRVMLSFVIIIILIFSVAAFTLSTYNYGKYVLIIVWLYVCFECISLMKRCVRQLVKWLNVIFCVPFLCVKS